ncbi:tetratricopeptide repeat protein [Marinigracilibium pacificum]|uniref:Sel1 repeat family protein n=1 Tax=Marinigracilibium pacificum TaxID=2729599 RepID=A0A848IZ01_9BACT|nr:tetratricopeptide repeat protein [Marinigracilibium pacificum]NMM47444.1 sel1 repeat family protein [Marinigracilibium pacificum]
MEKSISFHYKRFPLIGIVFMLCFFNGYAQDYKELYDNKNYDLIKKNANKGDAEAQFYLAKMYLHGRGVESDFSKTLHYYELAAEQGHLKSINNLGYQYFSGENINPDYEKAYKWWSISSEKGHGMSTYNLGIMYEKGKGFEQDYEKAMQYFRKAVDQGYEKAYNSIAIAYLNGNGVEQNYESAKYCFEKAGLAGNHWGYKNLADMYRYGQGMNKNLSIAQILYKKAIEEGNKLAQEKYEEIEKYGVKMLYDKIPHDKLDGEFGKDFVSIPVYYWGSPTESDFEQMNGEKTFNYYDKYEFNKSHRQEVAQVLSKDSKNEGVRIIPNEGYFTLSHQPASGYSKWVFPDFGYRGQATDDKKFHSRKTFSIDVSIPEGKDLATMELPIQLRTSLSPGSAMYVNLRNDGSVTVRGVSSENKKGEYVFISNEKFKNTDRIRIVFTAYTSGYWTLTTNKFSIEGYGALESNYTSGLSNHCFFEGDLNVHEILIYEDFAVDDVDHALGLPFNLFQNIQTQIGKKVGEYANRLFKCSDKYNFDNWQYMDHITHYVLRENVTIKGDLDTVIEEDKNWTAYKGGMLVKGKNDQGDVITVPVDYTIAVDENTKNLIAVQIESEIDKYKNVIIMNDLERFMPQTPLSLQ